MKIAINTERAKSKLALWLEPIEASSPARLYSFAYPIRARFGEINIHTVTVAPTSASAGDLGYCIGFFCLN